MRSTRCLAILILASFVVLAPGPSQAGADEDGIRQAVLNYANSAYLVRPDLVEESVHPKLQKIGYIPNKDGKGYRELWMNFEELKDLVAGWNADGRRPVGCRVGDRLLPSGQDRRHVADHERDLAVVPSREGLERRLTGPPAGRA